MRTPFVALMVFVMAACTPRLITAPDPTQIASSTSIDVTSNTASTFISTPQPGSIATLDKFDTITTKMPERILPTDPITPVIGEVPTELLDFILKDLVERTGAASEQISVIQAQAIVWNDGSLGCPQPGMFYTQALVNGYRVLLEIDGKKFDYRAADTGYFFLCENGFPPISPPSTPSS